MPHPPGGRAYYYDGTDYTKDVLVLHLQSVVDGKTLWVFRAYPTTESGVTTYTWQETRYIESYSQYLQTEGSIRSKAENTARFMGLLLYPAGHESLQGVPVSDVELLAYSENKLTPYGKTRLLH